MQVKQLKNSKLEREYAVTVSAAEIEAQMQQQLQVIGHQVKIPGFRPGKVPASLLRQRYGKSVMGEVLEKTVNKQMGELLREKEERPAMQPKIEITAFDEGKDLEFTVAYEVLPEVPEVDFAKITVEKLTYDLPESEVEEGLERLASYRKSHEPKEGKAAKGDAVKIDFKGFLNDVPFAGGEAKGHVLELGSNSFIPGFEDQLIGAKSGDDLKVKVTFPKEYHSKDLAGQPTVFEVKVHEVLAVVPGKVDDTMAKSMGMDSLDKLKEAIRGQIAGDYDNVARTKLKKALFDELDGACKFEAPKSMIEAEFETIWKQIEEAKKRGEEELDKPEDELRAEYQAIAERRVKLGLLLSDVGRKNGLKVNQDELSRAVMNHARQFPGQEQRVLEYYQKNPQELQELQGPIIEEKSVDFILGKVKLNERKVSIEELIAEDAETGGSSKPKAKAKPAAKKKEATKDGEEAEKADKKAGEAKKKPSTGTKATSKKKTA